MVTRKIIFLFCIFLCSSFLVSCDDNDNEQDEKNQTVLVTFFNESKYRVIIHRDSFWGPIIAEVNTSDRIAKVRVAPSDNKGTVFSIEFIWPIQIVESINSEVREVPASGIDPNLQIQKVIVVGKPCTVQIPQPKNLEIKSAFMIIKNAHNLPINLRYIGNFIGQADNGNFPIASYRQGIYKLDGIPDEGEHCQYYNIASTFESAYFSDFIPQNGIYITKKAHIYKYTFNGTSIEKTGEESIVYK
jgi:hypothetical protein